MHHQFSIYNGTILEKNNPASIINNTSLYSGNVVSQYGIIVKGKFLFWDKIYFNLMASMRKMRMSIPMEFTLGYFKEILEKNISTLLSYRYEIVIIPDLDKINYLIQVTDLEKSNFSSSLRFEIDLFKEVKIYPTFLSGVFTPKPENVIAQKYADENQYDDVILLNSDASVARTIQGNLYFIINDTLYTNQQENGAYRQAIDQVFQERNSVEIKAFSAFELQKADSVFILSERQGLLGVTQFRKKHYSLSRLKELQDTLIQ